MTELTPYSTTFGSSINTKIIEKQLSTIAMYNWYHIVTEKSNDMDHIILTGPMFDEFNIDAFTHPIIIKDRRKTTIYSDGRPFARNRRNENGIFETIITNTNEMNLLALTMHGISQWVTNNQTGMMANSFFPGRLFTNFLSNIIVTRLGLGVSDNMIIRSILALYYYDLFLQDSDVPSRTMGMLRFSGDANRGLDNLPQEVSVMRSLDDLATELSRHVPSNRISDIDAGSILTILQGAWYTYEANEKIAIAMEYPPYWNAIAYMALTTKAYRRSKLSIMANSLSNKNKGDEFSKELGSKLTIIDWKSTER